MDDYLDEIKKTGIQIKGNDGSVTITPDIEKEPVKATPENLQTTNSQSKLNFAVKKKESWERDRKLVSRRQSWRQ